MTDTQILQWIKSNLGSIIRQAINDSNGASTPYTEDWLAGIAMRETGELIARYAPQQPDVNIVSSLMRGDYSQRPGETEKQYHGFGFWQIDIHSFPDFIKSGNWKDPYKCCCQAIADLESARAYLTAHAPDEITSNQDLFNHYITAAYNCGSGNEMKVIELKEAVDNYTTGHDYSKAVFTYAGQYSIL